MSFSAFYSGLAGLQTNSNRLSVIGNNLANLNTVGFKSSRVSFADIFAQPGGGAGVNGAGNPQQIGLGVRTAGIQQVHSQGSLQTTALVTDVAIEGNGFFVLRDVSGAQRYSRAGTFTFDKDGFLVNPAGHFVQGYTAQDPSGTILASGAINAIQVPAGLTAPPQATSFLISAINLDGEAQVAAGSATAESFSTSMSVFDSLGARHVLTFNFVPVDTDGDDKLDQWDLEVTVPGDDAVGGTPGTPLPIHNETIVFDDQGQLISPAANVSITTPGWTNNAAAQTIDWQVFDPSGQGLLTGFAGPSAVSSNNQDGYPAGELRTLIIDQDGLLSGVFTNGSTLEHARFALANFNNLNGLLSAGQNTYLETITSGPPTIGAADSGGRGLLRSNALELSNVDITKEFTDLIISERGYQANSRIITTSDSVIQEALNLKR